MSVNDWVLPPDYGYDGTPSDPSPTNPTNDPNIPVEIVSINQIAAEIQAKLGENFTIFVDNNTDELLNVKKGDTIKKRLLDYTKTIAGVITTSTGEVVALKDLFSTSFGFNINFYTPTNKNIEPNLNSLILALNGALNEVDNAKYLLTFNMPTVVGFAEVTNGVYHQVIQLSGNVSITSASLFGNELKVTLDDLIDISKIMINSEINMVPELTPAEGTSDNLTPVMTYRIIRNTANFTVHMRKDSYLAGELFKFMITPNLLKDRYFNLKFNFNGYEDSWNTIITGISSVFSIGGYVILSIGFESMQVI